MSFPTWVWLYFGALGTLGAVLFTLIVWYWMKVYSSAGRALRSAAGWNMVGAHVSVHRRLFCLRHRRPTG